MGTKKAVVLGGGVAGICAAFQMQDRGYRVTLIEGHRWLGGRAFSVPDERLGCMRDNGPHVILGCYDHFRRLLRRLGTEEAFEQERALRLAYVERGGEMHRLKLSRLPTPIAMTSALMRMRALSFGERLRTLRGFVATLRRPPETWSVEEWLVDRLQQGRPRDLLWDPLCRAIMNGETHEVSAQLFMACLKRAFGGAASKAAIWIPKRPWLEIVGAPAEKKLRDEKVEVRLAANVEALGFSGERVASVLLKGGERIAIGDQDQCVSALPWHVLRDLLPRDKRDASLDFEAAPILNVYFDVGDGSPPLPFEDHLVYMVKGDPFHYMYRVPGDNRRFVLIGDGCRAFFGRPVTDIEAAAREQLAVWFPNVKLPADTKVRISMESKATFVPKPGVESVQLQPGPAFGMQNLFVCGDWTRTGLPSTLEGAAQSATDAISAIKGA